MTELDKLSEIIDRINQGWRLQTDLDFLIEVALRVLTNAS